MNAVRAANTVQIILDYVNEVAGSFGDSDEVGNNITGSLEISWSPAHCTFDCNQFGWSLHSNRAGCNGLLRNENGRCLYGRMLNPLDHVLLFGLNAGYYLSP